MDTRHAKSGQAVVEFCIGLIAILAVVGGIFQLGTLGLARMHTRVEATRLATERSMLGSSATGVFVPDYIGEVNTGTDNYSYSADDVKFGANEQEAYDRLAARLDPDQVRVYDPASPVSGITDGYEMRVSMGLVQGVASDFNIPVLPVVRHLIYDADSIDIQTEVWMTRTGDLY